MLLLNGSYILKALLISAAGFQQEMDQSEVVKPRTHTLHTYITQIHYTHTSHKYFTHIHYTNKSHTYNIRIQYIHTLHTYIAHM